MRRQGHAGSHDEHQGDTPVLLSAGPICMTNICTKMPVNVSFSSTVAICWADVYDAGSLLCYNRFSVSFCWVIYCVHVPSLSPHNVCSSLVQPTGTERQTHLYLQVTALLRSRRNDFWLNTFSYGVIPCPQISHL